MAVSKSYRPGGRATEVWARARRTLGAGFAAMRAIVPGPCALCGNRCPGGGLCPPCWRQLRGPADLPSCLRCAAPRARPGLCGACRRRPPAFHRLVAGMRYAPPGSALMLEFKQAGRLALGEPFAALLAAALADLGTTHGPSVEALSVRRSFSPESRPDPTSPGAVPRGEVLAGDFPLPVGARIVPVPSSPSALRRRGFNPAGVIAARLAARLELPLERRLLRWREPAATGSQRGRSRRQRLRRGRQAFQVAWPERLPPGTPIVLVDDVATTGATLDAAAAALRAAGAGPVWALAAARTPPPGRLPIK